MRLDSQGIKLLLVITPGFGRVIGDEEDAFLCKTKRIGSRPMEAKGKRDE
jgi:hypothetical protein